jgi:hypothetical protein
MIEIKPSSWDASRESELVKFLERLIAHYMTPQDVVSRPDWLVNQHGHGSILG